MRILLYIIITSSLIACNDSSNCNGSQKFESELGWWPIQTGNRWTSYGITPCGTVEDHYAEMAGTGEMVNDTLFSFVLQFPNCYACSNFRRFGKSIDGSRYYSMNLDIRGGIQADLIADFNLSVGQSADNLTMTGKIENTVEFSNGMSFKKGFGPLAGLVSITVDGQINGKEIIIMCDTFSDLMKDCQKTYGRECGTCCC